MVFDYSRTFLTAAHFSRLKRLAEKRQLSRWREALFSGEKINTTMRAAALHTALRAGRSEEIHVDGRDAVKDVHAELARMKIFTDRVRASKKITDIVHIGMGGSVLGPRLVTRALQAFHHPRLRAHFVSGALPEALKNLSPRTTLFVVVSKTFTTEETLRMMGQARAWFLKKGGKDFSRHLAGVTVNADAALKAGVRPENIFRIWDWVGGRYSVWSAVGITVMMMTGYKVFSRFLKGGQDMDRHFRSAPLLKNIPCLMALIGLAHRNIFKYPAYASIPYPAELEFFPLWLQQLDMESNGKSVDRGGKAVREKTGPVVFGALGEDAQHSFFQWLHQGTDVVPIEFIREFSDKNALFQAEALRRGWGDSVRAHNTLPGRRPSTVITLEKITPETLGRVMAAYEHKIFVQGVLWNINSFDQPGVEMVKKLKKKRA
jgi:glucose-6-phosphate isomerase